MKSTNASLSLYIGSIPTTLKRSNILSHFRKMGITIKINNRKSRPDKRFYVVDFESSRDALYVLKHHEAHIVEGHPLVVEEYLTGDKKLCQDQQDLGKKIYVGNLPRNTTDLELKEFFKRFGKVRSAYIKKKSPKSKKNFFFGFITFEDRDIATKVKKMKKIQYKGKNVFFRSFKSGTSTTGTIKIGTKSGSSAVQEISKDKRRQAGINAADTNKETQTTHAKKDNLSHKSNNMSFSHNEQETLQNKNFSKVPSTTNNNLNLLSNSLNFSLLSHNDYNDNHNRYQQQQQPSPNSHQRYNNLTCFEQQQQHNETRFGNEHFQRIREQFYLSPSTINRYRAHGEASNGYVGRFFSNAASQFDDFGREQRLRHWGHGQSRIQEYEGVEREGSRVQSEVFSKIHKNHLDSGNLRLNLGSKRIANIKPYYLWC